jgi:hypothetical protein
VGRLDRDQAILSKGISMLDMRVPGRMTVQVAEAGDGSVTEAPTAAKK